MCFKHFRRAAEGSQQNYIISERRKEWIISTIIHLLPKHQAHVLNKSLAGRTSEPTQGLLVGLTNKSLKSWPWYFWDIEMIIICFQTYKRTQNYLVTKTPHTHCCVFPSLGKPNAWTNAITSLQAVQLQQYQVNLRFGQ